jgi:hypothetical protein
MGQGLQTPAFTPGIKGRENHGALAPNIKRIMILRKNTDLKGLRAKARK